MNTFSWRKYATGRKAGLPPKQPNMVSHKGLCEIYNAIHVGYKIFPNVSCGGCIFESLFMDLLDLTLCHAEGVIVLLG